MGLLMEEPIQRVIQESVPGRQVTIAHVIASPVSDIYAQLAISDKGAIGILTLTPNETAIIAADIATKAANVQIGFLDRCTGSLVVCGDVQSVETSLHAVTDTLCGLLGFMTVPVTRT